MQRNIYQVARESAGYTQEKSSEMMGISVESLRSYELDKRIPPDKTVIKMIEIYDTRYLAYQHLKTAAEVGIEYMPEVNLTDISTAILKLQKEVNDFLKLKDDLLDITCDGVISEDEKPRWETILKELDDITNAIMSVKFAK